MCTVHCLLCIVYCAVCIVLCILSIVYCALYTVHCVLCIVHCVLCIVTGSVGSRGRSRGYRGRFQKTCLPRNFKNCFDEAVTKLILEGLGALGTRPPKNPVMKPVGEEGADLNANGK